MSDKPTNTGIIFIKPTAKIKNLGSVSISRLAIKSFSKQQGNIDLTDATNQVVSILQSPELERLHIPSRLKGHHQNQTAHLEFWVHRMSSCIFTVTQNGTGKVVSMVVKKNINDHFFSNEDY